MDPTDQKLLPPQHQLAVTLLTRLWNQAQSTVAGVGKRTEGKRVPDTASHPYDDISVFNVYTISGSRGAGKSTVLKAVRKALPYLGTWGPNWYERRPDLYSEAWRPYPECIEDLLIPAAASAHAAIEPTTANGAPAGDSRTPHPLLMSHPFDQRDRSSIVGYKTALVLPIIDPSQFESERHTVMEQVIAHLSQIVKDHLDRAESSGVTRREQSAPWFGDHTDRHAADLGGDKLRACLKRLQGEISRGWVFAQEFGQRMLQDDSASFDEFVKSRADRSIDAALRYRRWRETVDEVLDCLNVRLLVVCFDDCDLAPQHTIDVLDTIRVYLSAPRIAVVMATAIEELRHNLRRSRLAALDHEAHILFMASKSSAANQESSMLRSVDFSGDRDALDHFLRAKALSTHTNVFDRELYRLIQNEYSDAGMFLDKIVPINNRLYLHRGTPAAESRKRNVFKIESLLPGERLEERKRTLLTTHYAHIFFLLTQRQIAAIEKMMRADDVPRQSVGGRLEFADASKESRKDIIVEDMIAVVTPASDEDSVFAMVLSRPAPLTVHLEFVSTASLSIELEMKNESASKTGSVWIITDPVPKQPWEGPDFDRANALRGTLLAFLIDRRLSDRRDVSLAHYPISVVFNERRPRTLAPLYAADFQRLGTDPDGLLADLSYYVDFPRNCRSLIRAAELLMEREKRRTPFEKETGLTSLERFFGPETQFRPRLQPGKFAFLYLVERAIENAQYMTDLHYRLAGTIVALIQGDTRKMEMPDHVLGLLRSRQKDLPQYMNACHVLARRLFTALYDSRLAVSTMIDAAFIFKKAAPDLRALAKWTSPDDQKIDQSMSYANEGRFQDITNLFQSIGLDLKEGPNPTLLEQDSARDFILACLGPVAILDNCFGNHEDSVVALREAEKQLCEVLDKLAPSDPSLRIKSRPIDSQNTSGTFFLPEHGQPSDQGPEARAMANGDDPWAWIVRVFLSQSKPREAVDHVARFLLVPEAVLRTLLEQL